MELSDLEKFLTIAKFENLQRAADDLDTSASVLSKSLKRLETSIGVPLFDRVGKFIQINPAGERMRRRAAELVAQAKEARLDVAGVNSQPRFRIAGPSVLMSHSASPLARFVLQRHPEAILEFSTHYENQALELLQKGLADLAIVTTAIPEALLSGFHRCAIGQVTMRVAAAPNHPLLRGRSTMEPEVTLDELLEHAFVAPSASPFCGEHRGPGCDGWRDHEIPRKLAMIANDPSIVAPLVRSGLALAYLPDYWLREWSLIHVRISDCPYRCVEQLLLVSRQKGLVEGYQQALATRPIAA
ncbi:MAG: LysR family transcriptional regulator [Lysobacteraceae bacterium]|nr:MAG: LysR family transcriptional regulator [Xanthomonadaceae bacterium]